MRRLQGVADTQFAAIDGLLQELSHQLGAAQGAAFIEHAADFRRLGAFRRDDAPVLQGLFRSEDAQIAPGKRRQHGARLAFLVEQVADLTAMKLAVALHIGHEQLFLALEVVIKRAFRSAELGSDRRHRRRRITLDDKDFAGDVENQLAPVASPLRIEPFAFRRYLFLGIEYLSLHRLSFLHCEKNPQPYCTVILTDTSFRTICPANMTIPYGYFKSPPPKTPS